MPAETPPPPIDAAYLTNLLRPRDAKVREVVVESTRDTLLSRIVRLRLDYDGDAADLPATLILKTARRNSPETDWNGGKQEVAFYRDIAPEMPAGIVPRCFDANWDGSPDWHILLEDLAATHMIATRWPLPPTAEQCRRIVDTWARLHAAWWDDPRLGVSIGAKYDDDATDRYVDDLTTRVARFGETLGDRLTEDRRQLLARFVEAAPRLLGRHRAYRNMTLIHGDAHVWNVFLPKRGDGGGVIFDWDGWRVSIAARDLAYMMAVHWYPDRRRQLEKPLLDRYHATLLSSGVRGYSRAMLDDDYRLSVLMLIAVPAWQASFDLPPAVWWSHLERIMLAIDDLGCRDLLR